MSLSKVVAVINADQRDSRHRADQVPAALASLAGIDADGVLLGFERTAGDEIQGVCSSPDAVVEAVLRLTRLDQWRIGIGIGQIEQPLPSSTRAARGSAFLAARAAVEDRRSPQSLRLISAIEDDRTVSGEVYGGSRQPAWGAETALIGLRALARRRSEKGWEVAEMADAGLSQAEMAEQLGVKQSAISQRLAAAHAPEVQRLSWLASALLGAAMEETQ